jgi:HEAT repeat protein
MRIAFALTILALGLLTGVAAGQRGGIKGTSSSKSGSTKGFPTKDKDKPPFGGKTLEQWKRELKSDDPSKRTMAILAIMNFGEQAADLVSALIERLHDPDVSPRAKALLALRTIGIHANDVEKVVVAVSKRISPQFESQAVIRYEATVTLQRFLVDAAPAIPNLVIGTIDRSSWEIRHQCVSLLWRVGMEGKNGPDERAVGALLDVLHTPYQSYHVRLEALQGLTMMGRPAGQSMLTRALRTLGQVSLSPNSVYALWAFAAQVSMTEGTASEPSLRALSKYLQSKSLEVRAQAAQALGSLGKRAKSRVPVLLVMLKDKEAVAVQGACIALSRIGDTSERVVDGLLEVLEHPDYWRASGAVKALVDLKLNIPRVITAMDKRKPTAPTTDQDRHLRWLIEMGIAELKKPKK